MPANYWAEFIYDSCTIVLNVSWHAQVQGGFGGVGVEIGFCHWTGLAPLLHLHLQLCPPPIGPPKPTLGMDSPMLETEGQCGAGQRPRRVLGLLRGLFHRRDCRAAPPQSEWKWRLWGGRRSGDGDGVSNGNGGGR